jgi:hypothetical protein
MPARLRPLLLLGLLLLALPASADAPRAPRPLFAGEEILTLTIEAPVDRLVAQRDREGLTVPGRLLLGGASPETHAITLGLRGKTRRKRETCPFPPLDLRFSAAPSKGSLFAGQRQLKLVTHCRAAERFQQHVLLEYAAYRLLNLLTPQSFLARLAQIDYVGADGRPITRRYGILLEPSGQVARRNRMVEVSAVGIVPTARLDPEASARVALFQELIGNLDWAMSAGPPGARCCHNARLIGLTSTGGALVPVPYDFDYSGLVNAPYAVPPDSVPVRSVRERRYRGFCRHNQQALALAPELAGERDRLLAVFGTIGPMEEPVRGQARAFLASYLDRLGDGQALADRLARQCLK